MKELAKACKELGLGFGILLFAQSRDWTFPGGNGRVPRSIKKGKEVEIRLLFQT